MPEVRGAGKAAHPTPPDPTRADALSRIAAKVSGRMKDVGLTTAQNEVRRVSGQKTRSQAITLPSALLPTRPPLE